MLLIGCRRGCSSGVNRDFLEYVTCDDRNKLPIMQTETNIGEGPGGDEAVQWPGKLSANVLRVRINGIPNVGFTWHSLTDQVNWDTATKLAA